MPGALWISNTSGLSLFYQFQKDWLDPSRNLSQKPLWYHFMIFDSINIIFMIFDSINTWHLFCAFMDSLWSWLTLPNHRHIFSPALLLPTLMKPWTVFTNYKNAAAFAIKMIQTPQLKPGLWVPQLWQKLFIFLTGYWIFWGSWWKQSALDNKSAIERLCIWSFNSQYGYILIIWATSHGWNWPYASTQVLPICSLHPTLLSFH